MKYHIYLTTNLVNNKKYIGKHYGELNDSYLGSGKLLFKAVRKYGASNFKKEILEVCSETDIDLKEVLWIQRFDAVKSKSFYNISEGGSGGNTLKGLSEIEKLQSNKLKSEGMKIVRNNPILEKQRDFNLKQTILNQSEEWKRARYDKQRGSNNYNARKVKTPSGIFGTASDAAKCHGVHTQTVLNRCKHIKFKEWEFIDGKT